MSKRKPFYALAVLGVVALLLIARTLWTMNAERSEKIAVETWNSLPIGMTKSEVLRMMNSPPSAQAEAEVSGSESYSSPLGSDSRLVWKYSDTHWIAEFDSSDRLIAKYPTVVSQLFEAPSWFERLFLR